MPRSRISQPRIDHDADQAHQAARVYAEDVQPMAQQKIGELDQPEQRDQAEQETELLLCASHEALGHSVSVTRRVSAGAFRAGVILLLDHASPRQEITQLPPSAAFDSWAAG